MRVVGVDLGERRIGIAVSDSRGCLASPRTTIVRHGDRAADRRALVDLVEQEQAGHVVVGLPIGLDGHYGPAARSALAEVDVLRPMLEAVGATVELCDERLTTVQAHRNLRDAGRSSHQRRRIVDQAAAAVLLQTWLDAGRGNRD